MAIAEPLARKKPARASDLRKAFESQSVTLDQKAPIVMPALHDPIDREPDIFVPENDVLPPELDMLAFNEELVKIQIHRSAERFQPKTTDFIAVNGKPAEMLFKNGMVSIGYLPRGVPFFTRRKYVEQLAHAKVDNVTTEIQDEHGERPKNITNRATSSVATFVMLEDKNPRGVAWLESILRNQS